MSIATFAKRSRKVLSDNSPAILSGAAIAGTIITAVLSARAGYKASEHLQAKIAEDPEFTKELLEGDRPRRTIAKETWKLYTLPAVTGVGTVMAIATGTKISTNRTAALAAAYTITDRAFGEYKAKVVETLGEKKEQTEIRDKIMQDRVNADGQRSALVVISNNDVLCYDAFSDRYFQSSMEEIKKAQNDTNYEIQHNLYCSLTEFYNRIGLPETPYSNDIGWSNNTLVDLEFSTVLTPDQRPALGFNFRVEPIRSYWKNHGPNS